MPLCFWDMATFRAALAATSQLHTAQHTMMALIMLACPLMPYTVTSSPACGHVYAAFPKDAEWEQLDVLTPRLLYCVIHFGQFIFGLYKLNAMGLLPVHPSDWISTMQVPPSLEYSFQAA